MLKEVVKPKPFQAKSPQAGEQSTRKNKKKMTTILQVNQDDLKNLFRSWMDELKDEAQAEADEKANDTLVSQKDVEERLGKSPTTLWRWAKAGYLSPIYIGGRKMYHTKDIDAIIEQGGTQ